MKMKQSIQSFIHKLFYRDTLTLLQFMAIGLTLVLLGYMASVFIKERQDALIVAHNNYAYIYATAGRVYHVAQNIKRTALAVDKPVGLHNAIRDDVVTIVSAAFSEKLTASLSQLKSNHFITHRAYVLAEGYFRDAKNVDVGRIFASHNKGVYVRKLLKHYSNLMTQLKQSEAQEVKFFKF